MSSRPGRADARARRTAVRRPAAARPGRSASRRDDARRGRSEEAAEATWRGARVPRLEHATTKMLDNPAAELFAVRRSMKSADDVGARVVSNATPRIRRPVSRRLTELLSIQEARTWSAEQSDQLYALSSWGRG